MPRQKNILKYKRLFDETDDKSPFVLIDKNTYQYTRTIHPCLVDSVSLGKFSAILPDPVSFYLEEARSKIKKVDNLKKKLSKDRLKSNSKVSDYYRFDSQIIDECILHLILIPTLLCAAMETFVNRKIETGKVVFGLKGYEKKEGIFYDYSAIQRYESLDVKIAKFLPLVTFKENTKNEFARSLAGLIQLRNETVHLKAKVSGEKNYLKDLFKRLLDTDMALYLKSIEKMIKHYGYFNY